MDRSFIAVAVDLEPGGAANVAVSDDDIAVERACS